MKQMKKHLNLVTVILFVIALASFAAAVKIGHGGGFGMLRGFSSGG
jgi:hypothetical protein